MSSPNFYMGALTPNMEIPQFRDIYTDVLRVARLAGSKNIMSFGPSLLGLQEALQEGYIESPEHFEAHLMTSAVSLPVEIEGDTYEGVNIFLKQGGNSSADPAWLGNVSFKSQERRLEYKMNSDGRIDATRWTDNSPWRETMLVREPQAANLHRALEVLKQDLHEKKLGNIALTETVHRPLSARERVVQFLTNISKPVSPSAV